MDININSPMYYKDLYGVDDEIYRLCQGIHVFFKEKKYSDVINIIGIIPIITPQEFIEQGKYKEIKFCSTACGFADVQLFIDYDKYVNADIDEKKKLIVDNVLRSVKSIKGRGKIDYSLFESDMKSFSNDYLGCDS